MKIKELVAVLEQRAPPSLQEDYDNSGLQVGDPETEVNSALVCLDCTEAVVEEAATLGCGLIISHHPVIFKGLKSLVPRTYVERTVLSALKHGIALYAIHTNLDNVVEGVNGEIAAALGLRPISVLDPKAAQLRKLVVFVPMDHAEKVRNALFAAGAGHVGAYDQCSFNLDGKGTFRAGEGTKPYVGERGERHNEPEVRMEMLYPVYRESSIMSAMRQAHPYEEIAFDLYLLANSHQGIGSGLIGEWEDPLDEQAFLGKLKSTFGLTAIRHSKIQGRSIRRVALCGGSGSFLLEKAVAARADAFVTGDMKYHQFFDVDGRLLLADIGHYGSEQLTPRLIRRWLGEQFPTFAVRLTEIVTDPIYHF
ncbi:MAG: Nif3-like dinuclear metal center hexameric protein [Flavobacteriales bacterium]|nr:Nif3-like dinuclear metal center hexameric protein [Flavobacteriales bacterium]MCC6936834.1 Nif3-like dinuclear metal center hexameric protein [Flavobacteriales bacterium]